MVFQLVMWCSSGRKRVVTRLIALAVRWKQFLRRREPCRITLVQDRQQEPEQLAQVCATLSSHLPGEEQETQTCKAVIPVTTPMNESVRLIVVHNLKKIYQYRGIAQIALTDLSLEVAQGEFIVVTGPAGAGKSTLLHILGCMLQPSAGSYCLGGSMINLFPTDKLAALRNQRIGFIFREPALLPHVSALKNVALPLLYAGFSEAEQKRRAQKILQFVGLSSRQLSTPEYLSPGQQQRVAIARALVNSPSLLCADDPTGNLDTRSGREIMAILQALNRRKVTIIMVTQNVELAMYAKRHIILRDGCIISDTQVSNMRVALDDLPQTAALTPVVENKGTPIGVQVREEAI
jgi:putative ABC transport system ATP-binding protein